MKTQTKVKALQGSLTAHDVYRSSKTEDSVSITMEYHLLTSKNVKL